MTNQNIPNNTNNNRNAVDLQNKKAVGNEAQQVANNRPNQVVIPPYVGQRNIVVRSKTLVLIAPEGEKARRWVDADTLTREEWEMFFAEEPGTTPGQSRVHILRQNVNPPSLHERQLAHAERHPKDATAKRPGGLESETAEGAVEA